MVFLEAIPPKNIYFYFLYFLLGIIYAFCFEPFKIPFLSILVIGVFFFINHLIHKKFLNTTKIYFNCGISFGFGFFLLSMYWVSNSILEFNPDLYFLVPLILIFLPLSLSIFYGTMQLVNSFLWSNSNSTIFYYTAMWVIFEFLRSSLFSGLPWNLLGYSWSWSLAYSQFSSIMGVHGLGMVTVFCSACLFSYLKDKKNISYFLIAITLLILIYTFGLVRINHNQIIFLNNELRIVHTYFGQNNKWEKNSIDQITSLGSPETMTIFPETSFGLNADRSRNWVVGYIREENGKYYNSIKYNDSIYDKKILVPFGEYFPFSKFLNALFPTNPFDANSLTKGSNIQFFNQSITPLICYESIFPSFVKKSITDETELIVNISNDGWFGKFSGPKQHFVHSRYRSIELGIPMARSSNKGFSGLIGPLGEIIKVTNVDYNSFMDVKIPKKLESTIYRKYGNLFTYFLIVLFFIIGYAKNLKKL